MRYILTLTFQLNWMRTAHIYTTCCDRRERVWDEWKSHKWLDGLKFALYFACLWEEKHEGDLGSELSRAKLRSVAKFGHDVWLLSWLMTALSKLMRVWLFSLHCCSFSIIDSHCVERKNNRFATINAHMQTHRHYVMSKKLSRIHFFLLCWCGRCFQTAFHFVCSKSAPSSFRHQFVCLSSSLTFSRLDVMRF